METAPTVMTTVAVRIFHLWYYSRWSYSHYLLYLQSRLPGSNIHAGIPINVPSMIPEFLRRVMAEIADAPGVACLACAFGLLG